MAAEAVRILHLLDHSLPRHSAYARRTMAILRQQRAMGWHTTQLTGPRQGLFEPDRNRDGWHFFRTAPAAGLLSRVPLFGAAGVIARRLRKVAELTRPDLLHAHSPPENALAALRVGRRLGLPVVFEVHAAFGQSDRVVVIAPGQSLRQALARGAERWCARRADAVTTSSEGLRAQLEAGGLRRSRVTVVPNAVDLRDFPACPPAPRRDLRLARQLGLRDGPVLGYIGAFHRYEGVELLIDALPALLRVRPQLQLLLAGRGAQQDRLRDRVLRHGVAASVVLLDTAPAHSPDPAALHALADVLLFPRLPQRAAELVPAQRLLEAMARGCLVAASNVGGHRELVDHGRTGMLFEAGSADALADAVNLLLESPARWPAMRAEARWFVEYQRSWEVSVGRYAPLYRRLLGRHS